MEPSQPKRRKRAKHQTKKPEKCLSPSTLPVPDGNINPKGNAASPGNHEPSMVPPSREKQVESAKDAPTVVGETEKVIPATETPVNEETVSVPVALVAGIQSKSSKYLNGEEYHHMLILGKEVENLRKELSSPGPGLD